MNCPVCDERMREVSKHGVDVDICPSCKGIWLDRGELEKLLDMAASGGVGLDQPYRSESAQPDRGYVRRSDHDERSDRGWGHHDDDDEDSKRRGPEDGRRRRRGSWLGDILEGFGGGD